MKQHAIKFQRGCNYNINPINTLVCEPTRHKARKRVRKSSCRGERTVDLDTDLQHYYIIALFKCNLTVAPLLNKQASDQPCMWPHRTALQTHTEEFHYGHRATFCGINNNTLQAETPAASLKQTFHSLKLQWKKCHRIDFRCGGGRWRWGTSCIIQAV